ncbi:MAG: hypothetical protein ACOYD0_13130 [Candidatus Nanopelagicales bacterium]
MSFTDNRTAHQLAQKARAKSDAACLALASGIDQFRDDTRRTQDRDVALNELHLARAAADAAIVELVGSMRFDGTSWSTIGDLLRMSKQGAQQRYGAEADDYARRLMRAERALAVDAGRVRAGQVTP